MSHAGKAAVALQTEDRPGGSKSDALGWLWPNRCALSEKHVIEGKPRAKSNRFDQ